MIDKKRVMSLFIAAIMILSVIGFVLVDSGDEDNKKKYNGYKFIRLQRGWRADINGEKIVFNYLPQQTEDIKLPTEAITALQNAPIIALTYDPNSRWAEDFGALQYYFEQSLKSPQRFVLRALTNNTKYPNIPQITCANASQKLPVIILDVNKNTNGTQVTYNNNCLTANAQRIEETYRTTDRLIYRALKVMKE